MVFTTIYLQSLSRDLYIERKVLKKYLYEVYNYRTITIDAHGTHFYSSTPLRLNKEKYLFQKVVFTNRTIYLLPERLL